MTTIGDLLVEFPSSHTKIKVIKDHFLRKYEEIHNCVIANEDTFNDRAQQYKKQFKTYQNQEKFRIHCSNWMNLPALNKPPSCLRLLSSSQIRSYFSTETLTELSSEMVLSLMSNVHSVTSIEEQRSILQMLSEDTFRKLLYSLPRPLLSTYLEKIIPKHANSTMSDTLKKSLPETPARRESKFQEEFLRQISDPFAEPTLSIEPNPSSESIQVSIEPNPHANNTTLDSHCNSKPSSPLKEHRQSNVPENADSQSQIRLYTCQDCVKTFTRKDSLTKHMIAKHSDHPGFKCNHCSKTFLYVTNLKRHMKVHSSDKNSGPDFKGSESRLYSLNTETRNGKTGLLIVRLK